jgi:hypothetical protein
MLLPEERAEFDQIEQAHDNARGDAQAYAAAAACIAEGQS